VNAPYLRKLLAALPARSELRRTATRVFLFAIFFCIPARAETLSLPLKGYFHPGRAMPIEWNNLTSNETIQLSATGAITSRIQTTGNTHGIFPWLVIDQYPANTDATLPPLHPLEDSDLLIASTLEDDSPAATLFPGRRQILLHPPKILEGPEMAWETLDVVLLTPEALAKVPVSTRANLFAAGVELVALSHAWPDRILPWHKEGPWWIASPNLHLPPPIDPDAFSPTDGWTAGRSRGFRRHIFLLGLIYSLVIAGLALWRSRAMPTAIITASIVACAIFWLDNNTWSPISRRDAVIRVIDKTAIDDHWTYQVSHRAADFIIPFDASIHPVFMDASDMRMMNLTIDFMGPTARPLATSGRLPADRPFALMTRRFPVPPSPISLMNPPTTPTRLLANDPIYRDFKIRGELTNPTPDQSWPSIVLQHR
jgi:hypothetical protein